MECSATSYLTSTIVPVGSWHNWIEEQNTHEDYAEMDARKEDAETTLPACWLD